MASKQLSATMAVALVDIIDKGGKIIRHQGGYWTEPGAVRTAYGSGFSWYLGTSTVHALVSRGELEYVEWRDGRNGRFPIAAERRQECVEQRGHITGARDDG